MALTVLDATEYIASYCVDVEDWLENTDDAQRQRCVNVADRTLKRVYKDLIIPDHAVYEFANVLAIMFSDTLKASMHGINSFTINGLGTWDFRGNGVESPADLDYAKFIPKTAKDLIAEENNGLGSYTKVKWTGV